MFFGEYPLGELLYLFGFCGDLVHLLLTCCIVFEIPFREHLILTVTLRALFVRLSFDY